MLPKNGEVAKSAADKYYKEGCIWAFWAYEKLRIFGCTEMGAGCSLACHCSSIVCWDSGMKYRHFYYELAAGSKVF